MYSYFCSNVHLGFGVFTTEEIRRDAFIICYSGEVLTEDEGESGEEIYGLDQSIGSFLYFFKDINGKWIW